MTIEDDTMTASDETVVPSGNAKNRNLSSSLQRRADDGADDSGDDTYILQTHDVCKLLNRSPRTVSRYVTTAQLKPRVIKINEHVTKHFFDPADVEELRKDLWYAKWKERSGAIADDMDGTDIESNDDDQLQSHDTEPSPTPSTDTFTDTEDRAFLKETIRDQREVINSLRSDLRDAHASHAEERTAEREKQREEIALYKETMQGLLEQNRLLASEKANRKTDQNGEGDAPPRYEIKEDVEKSG
ncbi:MAG: hypothetical protein OYG31_01695 [Candidatus Kaiserbacteria bacterium]|nr:hypothetical protein [Candidatus Kaiserbacteria bacterium]